MDDYNKRLIDDVRATYESVLTGKDRRPVYELLTARRKDMTLDYKRGFVGMTEEPVSLKELVEEREILITEAVGNMPEDHKRFLLSFERGKPDWSLIGWPSAAELPAIKWRQRNLDKVPPDERASLVAELEKVLAA